MLDQLILYFVSKSKGSIAKAQLARLLYLSDLYSVKWTGKQVTDLDWRCYKYGPWDKAIDVALARLSDNIAVQERENVILLNPVDDGLLSASFDFPLGLELMLENIRREWADNSELNDLRKYIYGTAPMVEAKKKATPKAKMRLNLHLEREKVLEELGA